MTAQRARTFVSVLNGPMKPWPAVLTPVNKLEKVAAPTEYVYLYGTACEYRTADPGQECRVDAISRPSCPSRGGQSDFASTKNVDRFTNRGQSASSVAVYLFPSTNTPSRRASPNPKEPCVPPPANVSFPMFLPPRTVDSAPRARPASILPPTPCRTPSPAPTCTTAGRDRDVKLSAALLVSSATAIGGHRFCIRQHWQHDSNLSVSIWTTGPSRGSRIVSVGRV
ncbi:hypothetical protein TgHK011_007873 [Trichoderma gracile]|nr:hypothetical protein TgHK011_007873 [Trichoderma gracile]